MMSFLDGQIRRSLFGTSATVLAFFVSVGKDGTAETITVPNPHALHDQILATSTPALAAFPVPAAFLLFALGLVGLLLVSQDRNRRSKSARSV